VVTASLGVSALTAADSGGGAIAYSVRGVSVSGELLYLRPDVQAEPLVDQWYAWSHLVPPAVTARNITQRHLRIMNSYLQAPAVHATAVRNPRMLGGPFMDLNGARLEEIRALRDETLQCRAGLVQLSAALEQLDEMLRTKPDGHSLQPFYAEVPEILRGYVELAYDIRNAASFRVIEALLYRSRHYDPTRQSLMLSITAGDERPFGLSTPRLARPGALHLRWSFADERIERLFRLKQEPSPWSHIASDLGLTAEEREVFRTFLTPEASRRYEPYRGRGVRWRYFGHACILLETRDLTLLFDPVVSYTYRSEIQRYTYADLPDRIDFVLITHNHQDHVLIETLLQLRHKIGQIIVPKGGSGQLQDPSLRLTLENIGFTCVRELGELDSIEIPSGAITGMPFIGEHSDLAVSTKIGYLVRLGREQLLFAADSCNIEPRVYDHVHGQVGEVGTLFLGMECQGAPLSWLYGPLLLRPIERSQDQSRRLNGSDFEQARALVECFGCRDVYVYAMGQEPWLNHVMSIKYTEQSRPIVESERLLAMCRAKNIVAERLFGEKEILIDQIDGANASGAEHARPVQAVG
jgi:L-ascorbate metabolism protein UlaG (beta-lactamase superfamily)